MSPSALIYNLLTLKGVFTRNTSIVESLESVKLQFFSLAYEQLYIECKEG